MKVYCRCLKCKTLLNVEYDGKACVCPSCGETVLSENDSRITNDYVGVKNGNLNVIGDNVDTLISKMNSKNSDKLLEELMSLEEKTHTHELENKTTPLCDAKIHDCVKYGDLFWTVIGFENGCKLLLSKECIGYDFDFQYGDNTGYLQEYDINYQWESSQYRRYLNTYFLENHFSEEEKNNIVTHSICIEEKGNTRIVEDKVFLLNKKEVMNYLPIAEDRIATMHVIYKDVEREWFLRIDDNSIKQPDVIDKNGSFYVLPEDYVVEWFRPAILIKK